MNRQTLLFVPEIEARIDKLLARMSLEEKVGQLNQTGPAIIGDFAVNPEVDLSDPELLKNLHTRYPEDKIRNGQVGALVGVMGAAETNRLQRIAVEETRLGIPLIFGLDVIHGYRTIFPIPLAEACSWEPDLARQSAEVAAHEAAAAGIHWTFAPMVDIARDARWGRIAEGAGEDPFLGSLFAAARVFGFQGEDLRDSDHLIACAKHYIAYGAASAGRDYNTVEMALQTLFEIYLPPFAAAVNVGVGTLMSSFNDLNGIPASANRFTLTDVLRYRLGFNGFVCSDYNAIGELINHGYAQDSADAGLKALLAGVDMDMVTESYLTHAAGFVHEGLLPQTVVDLAVRRVLRLKFLLGLFENPFRTTTARETGTLLHPDHLALARNVARRSIVLLKNDAKLLPLPKDLQRIAVIGPLADAPFEMLGSWSFTGSKDDVVTILAGIRAAVSPDTQIVFEQGCQVAAPHVEDFTSARTVAAQADVIVAVVGESAAMSGEASSRMELGLPGNQEALLKALVDTGKPLVVLLVNGRPLTIPWIAQHATAILETWQLGSQAGPAVADVLFGDYNPSAKLVATFPYSVGQEPIYYNHTHTGRPPTEMKFTSKYIDGPVEPLYPFGFGLSYTTFEYSALTVTPTTVALDGILTVEVTVTNTGDRCGEEIIQLYVTDLVASRVRPVKELKGFQKFALEPGESRRITLELAAATLGFFNQTLDYIVEPGKFTLWLGPSSRDGLSILFEVT